jgi:O-methyltransferase involved in polyketide biosynthesis
LGAVSRQTLFDRVVEQYLDREAFKGTLRKIASTAKGSIVAFDYFTSEMLESPALSMRSVRASLNAGGEPLKFGVERLRCLAARRFFEQSGLSQARVRPGVRSLSSISQA